MKKVQLFEQFIFEASNKKRIKEIQKEMEEINQRMEEVQDAMDNGDMDEDEAQLQLNDLDGNRLDLEAELNDLQGEDNKKAEGKIINAVAKTISTIQTSSAQSARWSVQMQYATGDKKKSLEYLKRRDDELEAGEAKTIEALFAKIDQFSDSMSKEMSSLYSFVKNDLLAAKKAFSKAYMSLQGAREACKDFGKGCDEVAARKKAYDEAAARNEKAQAELAKLAGKANVRV